MRTSIAGDFGTGGAPSVDKVYTDADTVKRVQKALGLKVDGIIGPQTRAAVQTFNEKRGASGDGSNITDGLLAAIGSTDDVTQRAIIAAANKGQAVADSQKKSNTGSSAGTLGKSSDTPGATEPTAAIPFYAQNVPYVNLPLWQVALGGIGSIIAGYGVYQLTKK